MQFGNGEAEFFRICGVLGGIVGDNTRHFPAVLVSGLAVWNFNRYNDCH